MKSKEKRSYRPKGLDFSNLKFSSSAEQRYVKQQVENVAKKIRELRKEQGLSQEELAEKLSVSVSTIKFIEQNQRAPSLPMLFKIFFFLNRSQQFFN